MAAQQVGDSNFQHNIAKTMQKQTSTAVQWHDKLSPDIIIIVCSYACYSYCHQVER